MIVRRKPLAQLVAVLAYLGQRPESASDDPKQAVAEASTVWIGNAVGAQRFSGVGQHLFGTEGCGLVQRVRWPDRGNPPGGRDLVAGEKHWHTVTTMTR